ncbi:hypothetical protein LPB68_11360 [Paenibacillus crassostreae]|nr:hypothetical protein LPB68_11360 [Paenibacillus crassostreae]
MFNKNKREIGNLYHGIHNDIIEAQARWREAHMYFDEAVSEDEVDYAIYMLEAAERKYQMHLKKAKNLGLNALSMSANNERIDVQRDGSN